MAKKYKMTGCARFLIFLLVFAPLVYFGVSYFRGENPVEGIEKVIPEGWGKTQNSSDVSDDAIIQGTIDAQKDRIEELEDKIDRLEEVLNEKNEEIRQLKASRVNN